MHFRQKYSYNRKKKENQDNIANKIQAAQIRKDTFVK